MQQLTLCNTAPISAPGVISGSAQSTGAISGDYTLFVELTNFNGTTARVGIEDSADGNNWAPLAVWHLAGPGAGSSRAMRAYDAPGMRANARAVVYAIDGSGSLNAHIGH